MKRKLVEAILAVSVLAFSAEFNAVFAQEETSDWLNRETLTGDWGGARTWLQEHGITLKPRVTQFYQGLTSGQGDNQFQYGGKADLLMNADLGKLGLWNGLSLTVHAEQNFGETVNGYGGTIAPLNAALFLPGMEGSDYFDVSSVYLTQRFGDSVFLTAGKINIIDLASSAPFRGGAGIDSFWNIVFAAPPSGTVPPYLMGALLNVRTEIANFGLWFYDPEDKTNQTGFENFFQNGVTIRGNVDFPVNIAGLGGHQGLVALYSTEPGTNLETIRDSLIPPYSPGTLGIKDSRYYFAYNFDQYLYQSKANPKEGIGLFGQFGISDGNPNRLHWMGFVGVGGTGMIPGRSLDNWGVGYYYAKISDDLKNSLRLLKVRDEQGVEVFYNFALTPWLVLGGDLQIIDPSLSDETAVVPGLRTVIRF